MTLPDGLKFLQFGWWLIHAVTIALVFLYAYRKGRDDERKRRGGGAPGRERPARPD